MTVRFAKPRDPRKVPQFTLWTMRKGDRVCEAPGRVLAVGDGLLELGLYDLRSDGTVDLRCSMAYLSADDITELAQGTRCEHEFVARQSRSVTASAGCARRIQTARWREPPRRSTIAASARPTHQRRHHDDFRRSSDVGKKRRRRTKLEHYQIGQQLAATLDERYRQS